MCVCVCVCVCVCTRVRVCARGVCTCVCMRASMCVHASVGLCLSALILEGWEVNLMLYK